MDRWFVRLAEVPGVGYHSPPGLIGAHLPGHDVRPRVLAHALAGAERQFLIWPSANGGTGSLSPAHGWRAQPRAGESLGQLTLRELTEALELPGTLRDYHFRVQGCCSTLYRQRLLEPWALVEVERFCLLDVRLIECYPEVIVTDDLAGRVFRVTTFEHLLSLYERSGRIAEALALAERGARLHQDAMGRAAPRLRRRLERIEAEDDAKR